MNVVDIDTGEIVGDKFAKLFFDDINLLFELSKKEGDLLMWMAKRMKLGNSNTVKMSPASKKVAAAQIKAKNSRNITEWLRRMVNKGVIKKKDPENKFDPYYVINPSLMFKGNDYQRAKVIIDYEEGKRRVAAIVPREGESLNDIIKRAVEKFKEENPEYEDLLGEDVA